MASHKIRFTFVVLVVFSLSACYPGTTASTTAVPKPTLTSTEAASRTANGVENLTILYTNDEHGWMDAEKEGGGAANLMGLWRQNEGYNPQDDFLILSGGDNWTGPAVST